MDPGPGLRKHIFQMQVLLQHRTSGKGLPKYFPALQAQQGHMVDGGPPWTLYRHKYWAGKIWWYWWTPATIQASKDPHIVEQTQEASAENLTKSSGESTPRPYTTTSSNFSEWKLASKKISGAATVPRESGGHKGTQQLRFGTLKLQALNKAACYSLGKSSFTEKSGNTWIKKDVEKRRNNK